MKSTHRPARSIFHLLTLGVLLGIIGTICFVLGRPGFALDRAYARLFGYQHVGMLALGVIPHLRPQLEWFRVAV